MEINRRNLAPLHCASEDDARHNLNSLHFDPSGKTVATDGHILAIHTPGISPERAGENYFTKAFSVPIGDTLREINKDQRKKYPQQCELRSDLVDEGTIQFQHGGDTINIADRPGDFAAWKHVVPDQDKCQHHVISISLHNLEKMIASARQWTQTKKGEQCAMVFQFPRNLEKPILVSTEPHKDRDGDKLDFVVMPCRP